MKRLLKYALFSTLFLFPVMFFTSCKEFLNPEQELSVTEEKLLNDWYEYRSLAMGMYGLQQQLVEQLLILGELREICSPLPPMPTLIWWKFTISGYRKRTSMRHPTIFSS